MTLLEKISYLMKENHLNKRQLSINLGLSYSAVDGFFKVSYERMKLPTFMKICDYFGVTMDSMAYDDREIEYRKDLDMAIPIYDREYIRKYTELDPQRKEIVNATIAVSSDQAIAEDREKGSSAS